MPTIFIFFGFRFMFYSNDHAPIHVHILKDGHEAKYNVDPVEQNREIVIDRWKNYFKEENNG